jgi:metallo-beta-lactamase family protein
MSLQIQFIGATGTVTGSKYLLTVDGKRKFLVDCGLFQGLKVLRLRNWNPLPFDPKEIEAVVLTHAHVDHTGYLPLLVKNGFRGKIYSSQGTAALCRILLPDAGHLQEEDADFLNRHKLSKHKPALPLYTEKDAIQSLDYFEPVSWNKKISLTPNLSFEFFPAGHIVGAAVVKFVSPQSRITFTGDLGRPNNVIMPPPVPLPETDYLIAESTYGNRTHAAEDPGTVLKGIISRTVARGGIVLIPSFAVGRAQELLYLIHQLKKKNEIPNIPVYLNSPMSVQATKIYCDFHDEHRMSAEDCEAICRTAHFITTVDESKRLNTRTEPSVIISASGMATGGRVLHHLKFLAPNPKNLILFAGFQSAGTRGEAMISGADHVKIHGEMVPIRAEVASLDSLSAHADANEMIRWLGKTSRPPKMTFITHGEPMASESLRKRIQGELHWPCKVPDYLEICEL